jgi:hypothetical protein
MTALKYYEISVRLRKENLPASAQLSWIYGLLTRHPFDNMGQCLAAIELRNHPINKHIWAIEMDALDAIGWDTTKFRVG